jgi:signal transduction histidine kinase
MTRLDMIALASQAGGEFEDKFAARRLELELHAPEQHAYVLADGRHLWRVFENLYNNAAKYAMEGTRVYADVYERDGNYVFTIKNVSAARLNISPDELTERFVRGDASRSTEGSGLGLSIAKSLTRLMGGELIIEIDGDLYKASVVLPKHEEPVETRVTTGTLEIS